MYEFWGRHSFCEMEGIDGFDLNDLGCTQDILIKAVCNANASLVKIISHKFAPEGSSIIAVLQESHVALHIYPEHKSMFMDAFTCGKSVNPEKIVQFIVEKMSPQHHSIQTVIRSFPTEQ